MSEILAQLKARYEAAAHAMQSGVAFMMNSKPEETEPKHLRVGINAAMVGHCGLAELLMAKGVFTREEYYEAMATAMEREAASYEKQVAENVGANIKLR